ncbi:HAMP domain-containing sensor histidine kinase [Sphingomonas sp. BGYR3]|uniref:sensor histidine kinase n=1 Tax=Sphingomonas sp. BGYR3 TaxID=2975483 RepID=UPI0021A8D2AF|nr:HAMP domain-containing sensor histidine kinase [Sphingomonas sp. BGYR3]MDG5487415.1 HAMP domain-containing sensor histidine kinase [Sphingomonas sp. BGYR3]
MSRIRLLPRSLAGQLALLVALALFVAQALNFALLLRERQGYRFAQIAVPTITRIVDAAERVEQGRLSLDDPRPRGRVRLVSANPVPEGLPTEDDVAAGIRYGLDQSQVQYGRIVAVLNHEHVPVPILESRRRQNDQRQDRQNGPPDLLVAVELPGKGWLAIRAPWPMTGRFLIWQLIAQTLVLYAVVMLPIVVLGRRIARPLRSLAQSAASFNPAQPGEPVPERGPEDVRSVISAYNGLSGRVTAMLDEKDRMLGAIGHDLRTPLAALRVRIESVEDEQDRARMAEIIEEMHRTLEDILSLARMGRPSEPHSDVDLAALVDAVVADFEDLGADVTATEAPRITIRIRPTLMRRALRNLIENAVKYAGSAEVRLVPGERDVCIEVADHGPGIPEDKIDDVFDAFIRVETSRNRDTGGIGLGLALARAIVRDAGGTITLTNRQGGGLIAAIRLPR